MKYAIKKSLSTTLIGGIILSSAVATYAMSDEEFKKAVLEQIQMEEDISYDELQEIKEELEDISREDILESLKEEIEDLENADLQSGLQGEFEELKNITDGSEFFPVLNAIYEELDSYYEEHYEDWEEELEYDFEEEKAFILQELEEEKKYVDDASLVSEIDATISKIRNEEDEDVFFDTLETLWDKLDEHYGIEWDDEDWEDDYEEEYDFEELQKEILEELEEEKKYVDDASLVSEVDATISKIRNESDEDVFFDTLDTLWDKLDTYYEDAGIDVLSGEEFFGEDFNFEEEKAFILEELEEEKKYVDDASLVSEVDATISKIRNESDEDVFFDTLDTLWEKIDEYYGIEWDDEDFEDGFYDEGFEYDDKDENYSFEEERIEIIEELQEELSYINDSALRSEVENLISKLEVITEEDTFFDMLEEIYEKIDTYYGEEFDDEVSENHYDNEEFSDDEEDMEYEDR